MSHYDCSTSSVLFRTCYVNIAGSRIHKDIDLDKSRDSFDDLLFDRSELHIFIEILYFL